ncbi:hypothetical protein ACN9MY_30190 [Pseudoduganella sp. R-31]|uniref:hypothetical protein n=2 Tax=Pseudoduganella TaxID=1522432 RepID=UPI003CEADC92
MKIVHPAALILALALLPSHAAEPAANSASIRQEHGDNVAVIRGETGIAVMNGETVELKDRIVYVNGRSFGTVPRDCEIKYVVSGEKRTLYVDGKIRERLAGK